MGESENLKPLNQTLRKNAHTLSKYWKRPFNILYFGYMDPNLDNESLEIINSSHLCNIELVDNSILKFLFADSSSPFKNKMILEIKDLLVIK